MGVMNKEIELKVLKQFIGALLDDDPGIHPKELQGKYKKRTEYMEGWNAGVIASHKLLCEIMEDIGIEVNDGDNCIDEPEIIIKG